LALVVVKHLRIISPPKHCVGLASTKEERRNVSM